MKPRRAFAIAAIATASLIAVGTAGLRAPGSRLPGVGLHLGIVILWALGARHNAGIEAPPPRPRRPQGILADPPVAELDKSTVGQLLAHRLRREPWLRVVVPRPDPPTPPPRDGLWDRELDG